METHHQFIVISGIPGCGKSTIGRALSQRLCAPYLAKDEYLAGLFDQHGCTSDSERSRLSRLADQDFITEALSREFAVLDTFWCHPTVDGSSGTPSNWLAVPGNRIVELFCNCSPELAAIRFLERSRHDGHRDSAWSRESLVEQSQGLLRLLPLGVGTTIEVNTTESVDTDLLAKRVQTALGRQPEN